MTILARSEAGSVARDTVFAEIQTARLDLVAVTPESLRCQVGFGPSMYGELGAILKADVPGAWPQEHWEPHVLEYLLNLFAEHPKAIGWSRYLLLRGERGRTLIGTFGAGIPKAETGESEIGYGLLSAWQRQGFAPEAVMAMLPWLERQGGIRAFVAQTFPELRGSVRVMEKCGFAPAGAGYEEGTVMYRRAAMDSAQGKS